jgi:hypothetical protein
MQRGGGDAVSRLRKLTPLALSNASRYSAVCGGCSLEAALSRAVAAMMLALS